MFWLNDASSAEATAITNAKQASDVVVMTRLVDVPGVGPVLGIRLPHGGSAAVGTGGGIGGVLINPDVQCEPLPELAGAQNEWVGSGGGAFGAISHAFGPLGPAGVLCGIKPRSGAMGVTVAKDKFRASTEVAAS